MESSRTNIEEPILALKELFKHLGYNGYEIKYMADLNTGNSRKKRILVSDLTDKYFIEIQGEFLLPRLDNQTINLGEFTFYGLTISERKHIKTNVFTFVLKCEIERGIKC